MKKILFTVTALSLAMFASAQEYGFGGDDFGSSYEESSEPSVTITGEVGTSARGWIGTSPSEEDLAEDSSLAYDSHGYDKFYDVSKSDVEGNVYANIEFNYAGEYTDANIKLKFDNDTIKEYPEDIIDEAYANGSFKEGRFQLKAGKMKEVWGKGDKVHVLDNFNANDYSDFIFPDYIDRRIGEVMFKTTVNLSWDYNLKLEGIYAPMMTADRFASDGMLVPYAQKKLTNTVTSILKEQGAAKATSAVNVTGGTVTVDESLVQAIIDLSEFSQDDLYEDNIKSIKYGQAGARLTGTLAGIDWGASYYYGHYKQPSANVEKYAIYANQDEIKAGAWESYKAKVVAGIREQAGSAVAAYTDEQVFTAAKAGTLGPTAQAAANALDSDSIAELVGNELTANEYTLDKTLPSLNYDQVQVFGLEAAFVLWKFNTRWEGAYNLTEDIAGDNPWVKNNSVSWLAGFDIDLPIHNLNLNVQETGTYILNNDKIEENKITVGYIMGNPLEVPIGTADVDYNSDGKYTKNKLIVLLSDKWLNEKLTTEVQGIYCFEDKGYMIAPKIEYNISEGLTFGLRGVYLYCDNENGEFYNFTADTKNHDKAFVELTAKYQF